MVWIGTNGYARVWIIFHYTKNPKSKKTKKTILPNQSKIFYKICKRRMKYLLGSLLTLWRGWVSFRKKVQLSYHWVSSNISDRHWRIYFIGMSVRKWLMFSWRKRKIRLLWRWIVRVWGSMLRKRGKINNLDLRLSSNVFGRVGSQ